MGRRCGSREQELPAGDRLRGVLAERAPFHGRLAMEATVEAQPEPGRRRTRPSWRLLMPMSLRDLLAATLPSSPARMDAPVVDPGPGPSAVEPGLRHHGGRIAEENRAADR